MENTYSIYKFTFSDGKVYIGQTSQSLEDRWKNGEGYKGQDVYVPIVLEGWDNIQKEILHTGLTSEQADILEKHYIKKYNSRIKGYNRTNGGKGCKKKEKDEDDFNHLKELTQNLIELCPALIAPEPNKLLTFQELREIGEKEPEKQLIKETSFFGCYFTTAKEANKTLEVYLGGDSELYHYEFLVNWRIWSTDPPTSVVINTPWLTTKQVNEYTSYFIKDPKIKNFYKKYHEYPSICTRGFKEYEEKYKNY